MASDGSRRLMTGQWTVRPGTFLYPTKVSAIAVLVNTTVNGISLSLTPPSNEIYEAVLRNKFESRDNMEKILLEIADLESSIETTDSAQSDLISKLKEDLQALQAAHEKSLGMVSKLKVYVVTVNLATIFGCW